MVAGRFSTLHSDFGSHREKANVCNDHHAVNLSSDVQAKVKTALKVWEEKKKKKKNSRAAAQQIRCKWFEQTSQSAASTVILTGKLWVTTFVQMVWINQGELWPGKSCVHLGFFCVQASVNKALNLINIPRTTARWKVMKGDNALRFSQCMHWAHGHTGKKYKSEKVTT